MVEEEVAVVVEERVAPARDTGPGMARGVVRAMVVLKEAMGAEAEAAAAVAEGEGLVAQVLGMGRGAAPDMGPGAA